LATFSEELFILSVSHAHYRERVGAHTANEALKILDRVYSESRDELLSNIEMLRENYGNRNTKQYASFARSLTEVTSNIAAIRSNSFDDLMDLIFKDLDDYADYEAEYTLGKIFNEAAKESLSGIPFSIKFEGINPAQLYAAAMTTQVALGSGLNGTLNSLIKKIPNAEQKRIFNKIEEGFVQNRTNQEIIRSIFNKKNNRAQESITRNSIDAFVRTATNSIGNNAHRMIAEANDDLIRGYRNVVVYDGRTSSICKSIAFEFGDKVLPYDDFPPVPRHLRCRSMIVAVLKPWNEVLNTGKVEITTSTGTQSFFAGPTKESAAQLTARLKREGMTDLQISKFKSRISGQTSARTLSDFLNEQKKRGNREFLDTFFDSKERAQLYIDDEYSAKELYNLESRKPIPLKDLIE